MSPPGLADARAMARPAVAPRLNGQEGRIPVKLMSFKAFSCPGEAADSRE